MQDWMGTIKRVLGGGAQEAQGERELRGGEKKKKGKRKKKKNRREVSCT